MSSQVAPPPPPRRTSFTQKRPSMASKKSSAPPPQPPAENGTTNASSKPTSPSSSGVGGERTVKKLRLSKALTIPEGTSVSDACRRMAARRVDAVLLTDSNALLSGIVTDKDITARVIAEELRPEQTIVSKIMTRNPIFVTSDTSAIEALQKMVQGKFRHLPVVENGEVIALLDITKCLYDAISRMEKAAEQGSAIAAAVEGVERQMGNNFSAPAAFIETLRERMFKPALSTIIPENTKVATVSPSDPVYVAAKKMKEFRVNSVIITSGIKVLGILTSKDILMRVVAQNLSPELTLVEKVMTPNPEYASVESTILEALHIMHDGKFLHLPVLDRDGSIVACVDVLTLTHAAISMAENSSGMNDMANSMMQKFWDSALALEPPDDSDSHSEMSAAFMNSEGTDLGRYPSLGLGSSISYKFEDPKGRVHRFSFGTENLDELVSAVMQRTGSIDSDNRPQLLYEDDEGDKILLTCDSDLIGAALHARSAGQKMDEDKHFLDMLDAATESVFEAYTGKMAAGSCTVVVPQPEQVVQYSQGLQQGKELGSQLSFRTTFPSESSGSLNEPQHRRKRCRTCEEPNFQGLVTKQNNLGLGDRNQLLNSNNHFNSWPQNFTFQSNGVNTSVGGFESKQSSFLANSHCQLPKKWPSRIQRNSSSTGAFDLAVSNIVESEKKVMENSVDFSKEIEDAIDRIESLIPSLQKLVNPPKQESMFNSGLPKISSSVNPTMKKKDWVSTRNEIYHTEKLATPGENKVGKQAGQMFTTCNVPSHVKWTRNKTNLKARINQFPGPKVKAGMGRPGSLKGTPSRNGSFSSHNPVRIQGSRIMPHESSIKGSIEKDKTSSPCSRVQSMGSTNFMRRNRNVGTSHQKRRRNRTVMPRDSLDRNNAAIRRNMNEASHSKITSDDRTSDETSWGSCASPSPTTQQSGSSFSSSGTYESSGSKFYDSDESKPRHETASRSITESSASDYDDTASSSYYNSRSEYSDVDHSSQTSSVRRHKWNVQKERGKRREGRLKRLRKKLGMVFHHHHHHHHHYSDKDEPDAHHASSFWARLGDMFHHTKNKADHHQKTKAEKPRKSEIKTVVKRKQQGPHFHALVDGLMKHMKHSKKPKQVKNGIKGLENARHRGKKLPCLPKIHGRRGGVKVSNKGKVKLGNYRSKSMAAAKMFLGK